MRLPVLFALLASLAAPAALAAGKAAESPAPVAPSPPPPYEDKLVRLSEILGSVQYLRSLCGADKDTDWRDSMQKLLDLETAGEPDRTEKLTAAFNRGYRAFAAIHTSCTPAAVKAEEQYRIDGATLATEIATRFGNL
ncbi:TIGR02301 family protein [Rhizobium sp. NRK18]|uniref:TIGR02301 family protein n=1 Tax=Rhizobium sp. NRK18 TaxID=2964667 RepID=UPI0021C29E94|nr:TIGR02301 family protein [Rhizobium sp. NRK18]MCQ2004756.1 TIGR02301 family protein [Rhizobium sp. NRK18]